MAFVLLLMKPRAVAVSADVDQVAVVQGAIDQGSGHDLVAEDCAPVFERFVGGQYGGGTLVAAVHQLEEEHRAVVADWEVANLIDDQERRVGQYRQTLVQASGGLGLLQ